MKWEICPDCGRDLPADEMAAHRPGGICLETINRNINGSPCNRVVSGSELATRTTIWPENQARLNHAHHAHISRMETGNED